MDDWLHDLMKKRDALDEALKREGVAGYLSVGLVPVENGKGVEIELVVFHNSTTDIDRIPKYFHGISVQKMAISDPDEEPLKRKRMF